MVGRTADKQNIGTLLLYSALDQIRTEDQPPFLQRNIHYALDFHRSHLQRARAPDMAITGDGESSTYTTLVSSGSRDEWRGPSKEMLEMYSAAGRKPTLKVVPKWIELKNETIRAIPDLPKEDSPDWLPKTQNTQINCRVTCGIYEVDTPRKLLVTTDSQLVTLVYAKEGDGVGKLNFHLDDPFFIPFEKLILKLDEQPPREGKARRWKETAFASYRMKLKITTANSKDAADLLALVDKNADAANESAKHCELRALWDELPKCPEVGTLLNLERGARHHARRTDADLAVDVTWSRPNEMPVVLSNKATQASIVPKVEAQPEPPKQDTTKEPHIDHEVTYVSVSGTTGQLTKLVRKDLKCPFCKTRLPQSSFERLHFHFLANHDHFKTTVKDKGKREGVECRTVHFELADRRVERASNQVPDQHEFQWIRPGRPFNIEAYLGGDESWTAEKGPARRVPNKSPLGTDLLPGARPKVKKPEDVKPITNRKRKRYVVPYVPGVTLYRNVSRRRIEAGEEVSESEDEVNVEWLQTKNRLRKVDGFCGPAEHFIKLFDAHMDHEKLCGDVFLSDAVVRFCRANAAELGKPLVLPEFKTKLRQLEMGKLLTTDVMEYCMRVVTGDVRAVDKDHGALADKDSMRRNAIVGLDHTNEVGTVTSENVRATEPENAEGSAHQVSGGTCVCGKIVVGARGAIFCSRPQCNRNPYHIACVGLDKRDLQWVCPVCRDSESS